MRLGIVESVVLDQIFALGGTPRLIGNFLVRRIDNDARPSDNVGDRGMFLDIPCGREWLRKPDSRESGLPSEVRGAL